MENQKLGYYEIMDRCHTFAWSIDEHLLSHADIDAENSAKIDQLLKLLGEVYQWAEENCRG